MNTALPMYQIADKFITQTNRNIFITGKAGTGKTTFLQQIKEKIGKQMAIVAPTGVAAINAGGTTIHSFFQLPFSPFIPTAEGRKDLISKLKMQRHQRKVIRELELLVIDEVSMVRADIMDSIDVVLRHLKYKPKDPFGGVQMVFIGDMFQLSPVAKEEEWRLLSDYYESIYFFHSKVISEQRLLHVEFDKIFRQSDMTFISLLNKIRNNALDNEALNILQQCYKPGFVAPKNETFITLTTHNYKADRINQEELEKIKNPRRIFKAEVKGEFPEKNYPVDEELELKIDAKVMFLKNDTETPRRFYNGKIGKIVKFKDETIVVECDNNEQIEIAPMDWHNIRYKTNEKTQQIDEEILGIYKQFPLRLAWAITIHKSQGLTFEKAIIDAGAAFASGQVYVALSRCRSLEGVVLTSPIQKHSIQNDEKIVRFSALKDSLSELTNEYEKSERDFYAQLLLDVFDLKPLVSNIKNLIETVKRHEVLQEKSVTEFANSLLKQSIELEEIASNFQYQLLKISMQLPIDEDFLYQRLLAAHQYFSDKLNLLSDTLRKSPANTDNKQVARDYDEDLKEIFTITEEKKHLIGGIKSNFSIQHYYLIKKTFILPAWNITCNSKKSQQTFIESKNSKLAGKLFALRNDIADEFNLPVFMVANAASIIEMADYLPFDKKDLLKINGFGDHKYDKFGEIFLDCIRDYCAENQLESNMQNHASKPKKERKEKPPKGNTTKISLEMFLQGNSIKDIAQERKFTEKTIAGHLVKYALDGTLELSQFISDEKLEKMKLIVKETENSEEGVYYHLKNKFSEIEIKFGLAFLRK